MNHFGAHKVFYEREFWVLKLRPTHTLREVGWIIGVTPERVRQIEAKAQVKLRKCSACRIEFEGLEYENRM